MLTIIVTLCYLLSLIFMVKHYQKKAAETAELVANQALRQLDLIEFWRTAYGRQRETYRKLNDATQDYLEITPKMDLTEQERALKAIVCPTRDDS